ncbi:hypothetical protein ACQKE5_11275 [Paenisporosarcina sp. NPDC076898]
MEQSLRRVTAGAFTASVLANEKVSAFQQERSENKTIQSKT